MDPMTLASTATALLAPYLAKAGEAIAGEAISKLPEGVDKLWGLISNQFKGKPAAEGAAQDLAEKAGDPDNQEAFSLQLKKALKENPEFATQLADMLKPKAEGGSIQNTGSGAVATNGGVAAGAGGIAIGGNVGGSVVFGNNNTLTGSNSD